MSESLVIVGMGMAAARLVEELSRRALGRYAIAVIGAEPRRAYNRVLLSSLLANEVGEDDIELKPASWWSAKGVTTIFGRRVVAIDREASRIALDDGTFLPFSKLVLATGSEAVRLPLPGVDLPGVMTFRDFGDVDRIRKATHNGARAVVIGGGLLGLEAASGLAKAGAKTSVVHLMDRLMERQLDPAAASLLRVDMERRGMDVHLGAQTSAIVGTDRVEGVLLGDGTMLPADMVVMAVGIRPQAELAKAAGLAVERGIVVDDVLATSDPRIHALGECAQHRGIAYGLVEPAYEQARVLAAHMCGTSSAYHGSLTATNLKVSGVSVFSAGDFLGEAGTQSIILRDPGLRSYKKLVLARDEGVTRLVGCVLFGDTQDGLWYFDMIKAGTPIDALRDDLVFGRMLTEKRAA
ncbi:MAG: assimilatory nitrate reductase beta subunit [Hyphomicrobiales bacterium]|nr:assimilatory nitrate reductase beta subunit [Hyphomicrobiales bacterium]